MPVEALRDELGRALGEIETFAGAPPRADVVVAADAPADAVVDAVWARLGGHRVSVVGRADAVDALVARGAVPGRHMDDMVLDLDHPSARRPVGDVTIVPMDVHRTGEYGSIVTRAYPPGHPDHEPVDADPTSAGLRFAELLGGEKVGPWMPSASFDARDDAGRVIGAIVLSEMPPSLVDRGGPWVSEIFVDPDHTGRGIGGALLARSVAALVSADRTSVGLAVTVGNPARRLYESFGFVIAREIRQVVLPA